VCGEVNIMRELMPAATVGERFVVARRMRILRHRALRWFQQPIRAVRTDRSAEADGADPQFHESQVPFSSQQLVEEG